MPDGPPVVARRHDASRRSRLDDHELPIRRDAAVAASLVRMVENEDYKSTEMTRRPIAADQGPLHEETLAPVGVKRKAKPIVTRAPTPRENWQTPGSSGSPPR